jgi:hypothetical protein
MRPAALGVAINLTFRYRSLTRTALLEAATLFGVVAPVFVCTGRGRYGAGVLVRQCVERQRVSRLVRAGLRADQLGGRAWEVTHSLLS